MLGIQGNFKAPTLKFRRKTYEAFTPAVKVFRVAIQNRRIKFVLTFHKNKPL
jgi:hypothetical protein